MKLLLALIVLAGILLLFVGSTCSTYTNTSSLKSTVSSKGQENPPSNEFSGEAVDHQKTDGVEKLNFPISLPPSTDTKDTESNAVHTAASNASNFNHSYTSLNENNPATASPPDGRIFSGTDFPVAYIPTCSPKNMNLPIVPLDPND